jgi:phosphatidate cytidylyltransferase
MWFYCGVLFLLVVCTVIGSGLKNSLQTRVSRTTINNLNARIRAWWKMCAIFTVAVLAGPIGALVLFGIISFLAMREYMTLVPTRRGDHRTLFWSFFVIMPLQYFVIGMRWYLTSAIMIPVLACLFIPPSIAIAGDTEHFLERSAKIQFGIMVCVYSLSHVPALLLLRIPRFEGHDARLLLYLVVVDQMSNALQFVWGKLIGKQKVAWRVSPNKTWEGFAGGLLSTMALGAALWWATPFTRLQSAGIAVLIFILGFVGSLVMSAIKRDIGIKDFGVMIDREGGILDRIDSLLFVAPIFFHLVRYFFAP